MCVCKNCYPLTICRVLNKSSSNNKASSAAAVHKTTWCRSRQTSQLMERTDTYTRVISTKIKSQTYSIGCKGNIIPCFVLVDACLKANSSSGETLDTNFCWFKKGCLFLYTIPGVSFISSW